MAPDTETRTVRRGEPVSDLTDTPVYTRDGYRLGRVAGVAVDVHVERATGLLVGDVDERRFPRLETGPEGVRVPYDFVAGVDDIVIVDVPGAAFGAGGGTERAAVDRSALDPSDADPESPDGDSDRRAL